MVWEFYCIFIASGCRLQGYWWCTPLHCSSKWKLWCRSSYP